MAKVAVPINMNQRQRACVARASEGAQQNRAIPSDDEREIALPISFTYQIRKRKIGRWRRAKS